MEMHALYIGQALSGRAQGFTVLWLHKRKSMLVLLYDQFKHSLTNVEAK